MSILKVRGLRHDAASTDAINLDSAGNVGIGTGSPSFPLDVAGAMRGNSWIGRSNVSAPTADCAMYRAADNTLAFSTANTERMRIDGSGRVTTPYQPTAHLVNTADISGTGRITTWTARINQGNHYSSGIFTCPVAGIYLINAMVWRNSGTVDYAVRLNSVNKARIRQSSVNDCGYSGAILLSCAANDTIDFYIIDNSANNLYGGTGYSETLTSALITLLG